MLRNENRVPFHQSLLSVIIRIRRCQTGCYEIRSMGSDGVDALVTDVLAVLVRQFESGSK